MSDPTKRREPVAFVRTNDATYSFRADFSAPPLIVNPAATRDDLIALATERADQLRRTLTVLSTVDSCGLIWSLADMAMMVLGDAEDLRALLEAANDLGRRA